jgi:hypothetical protein
VPLVALTRNTTLVRTAIHKSTASNGHTSSHLQFICGGSDDFLFYGVTADATITARLGLNGPKGGLPPFVLDGRSTAHGIYVTEASRMASSTSGLIVTPTCAMADRGVVATRSRLSGGVRLPIESRTARKQTYS